jgi:hypothetical protein
MSSSTKREVTHDPREIEPRQRRSSELNRKLWVVTLENLLHQQKLKYLG